MNGSHPNSFQCTQRPPIGRFPLQGSLRPAGHLLFLSRREGRVRCLDKRIRCSGSTGGSLVSEKGEPVCSRTSVASRVPRLNAGSLSSSCGLDDATSARQVFVYLSVSPPVCERTLEGFARLPRRVPRRIFAAPPDCMSLSSALSMISGSAHSKYAGATSREHLGNRGACPIVSTVDDALSISASAVGACTTLRLLKPERKDKESHKRVV